MLASNNGFQWYFTASIFQILCFTTNAQMTDSSLGQGSSVSSDKHSGNCSSLLPTPSPEVEIFKESLIESASNSEIFTNIVQLADISEEELGNLFYDAIKSYLDQFDSPIAEPSAELGRIITVTTFHDLTSQMYPDVIGTVIGSALDFYEVLTVDNAETLASGFLKTIEESLGALETTENGDYIQALITGTFDFMCELGLSPVNVIPRVLDMFWTHLSCRMLCICSCSEANEYSY